MRNEKNSFWSKPATGIPEEFFHVCILIERYLVAIFLTLYISIYYTSVVKNSRKYREIEKSLRFRCFSLSRI